MKIVCIVLTIRCYMSYFVVGFMQMYCFIINGSPSVSCSTGFQGVLNTVQSLWYNMSIKSPTICSLFYLLAREVTRIAGVVEEQHTTVEGGTSRGACAVCAAHLADAAGHTNGRGRLHRPTGSSLLSLATACATAVSAQRISTGVACSHSLESWYY